MPAALPAGADSLTMLLIIVCSFSCSTLRAFSLFAGRFALCAAVIPDALGYSWNELPALSQGGTCKPSMGPICSLKRTVHGAIPISYRGRYISVKGARNCIIVAIFLCSFHLWRSWLSGTHEMLERMALEMGGQSLILTCLLQLV